jgi:hypothetical protein
MPIIRVHFHLTVYSVKSYGYKNSSVNVFPLQVNACLGLATAQAVKFPIHIEFHSRQYRTWEEQSDSAAGFLWAFLLFHYKLPLHQWCNLIYPEMLVL